MADNHQHEELNIINKTIDAYRDTSAKKHEDTLASFEQFYESIRKHTADHRHITLNNLEAIDERIKTMHEKASRLKKRFFLHDEETIIDRQRVFEDTENKIRLENLELIDMNMSATDEGQQDIESFKTMLNDCEQTFFDAFESVYLETLTDHQEIYVDYAKITGDINAIIDRHMKSMYDSFEATNRSIKSLDQSISTIIQQKNAAKQTTERVVEQRKNKFSDQSDTVFIPQPTEKETHRILERKQDESKRYLEALAAEKQQIKSRLEERMQSLHDKQLSQKLRDVAQKRYDDPHFFDDPASRIRTLKKQIVEADRDGDKRQRKQLLKRLDRVSDWETVKNKTIHDHQVAFVSTYESFQTHYRRYLEKNRRRGHRVRANTTLFESLLDIDPFLAQIIGEQASHTIQTDLDWLDRHWLERDIQADIKADIGVLTTKNQINHLELSLTNNVKHHLADQQAEINEAIVSLYVQEMEHKIRTIRQRASVRVEHLRLRQWIKTLQANIHHLHEKIELNRRMQNAINIMNTTELRTERKHHIEYNETKTEIERALKKYDIETLGFKTLMENELNFLVMQSSRVDREEKIHQEFIINTYKNRMRFAKDEFERADEEYRMKIQTLLQTFDEEKNYHLEAIDRILETYDRERRHIYETYEEFYYRQAHLLEQTHKSSIKRRLNKEIDEKKRTMENDLETLKQKRLNDTELNRLEAKLDSLRAHYKTAFDDALNIRDETKAKMKEIYDDAKDRLEALEPYFKNKLNPLDRTFFDQLDHLNSRYDNRQKQAEKHLDESTASLIEAYRKIHHKYDDEATEKTDSEDKLRDLLDERDRMNARYRDRLTSIHDHYEQLMDETTEQAETKVQETQVSIDNIKTIKHDHESRLNTMKSTFETETKEKKDALDTAYEKAIQAYEASLKDTKKKHRQLQKRREERKKDLSASCRAYVKQAKKDKTIKSLFKSHEIHRKKRWKNIESTIKKETESLGFPEKTD